MSFCNVHTLPWRSLAWTLRPYGSNKECKEGAPSAWKSSAVVISFSIASFSLVLKRSGGKKNVGQEQQTCDKQGSGTVVNKQAHLNTDHVDIPTPKQVALNARGGVGMKKIWPLALTRPVYFYPID